MIHSLRNVLNTSNVKQLLDEVFVISRIIKVEVTVITLTETLIIPVDITKTEYFVLKKIRTNALC